MGSNSNKDWSKNETEELIKAYEKQSALWDKKHSDFNNRLLKITSWFVLSQKFDTSVEEIQRKIHNLRNQFNCELKKSLKRKSDIEEEGYTSKWIYFNQMMFLRHNLEHRSSRGNSLVNSPNPSYVEDQNDRSRKRTFSESSDTATTHIGNSEPQVAPLKRKKIGKAQEQRIFLQETLRTLNEKDDEYDIFGKYVGSELRSLTNNILRKKMKRKIQEVIIAIQEEDEEFSITKFFRCNRNNDTSHSEL